MTVLSKFVCLTLSVIKLGAGMYQVEVQDLSPGCRYLEISPRAGWWCCPFQSIPVEEYRGTRNMSERSYNYPRAECETLYPTLNITQNSVWPEASGEDSFIVWLVVGLVCCFVVVVIFMATSVVQYRRMQRWRLRQPNLSSIYLRAPRINLDTSQTLSTIVEVPEDNGLTDLLSDVEAARVRLSTVIQDNRRETTSRQFLGRRASTFNPRASVERLVVVDNLDVSSLSGSYDLAM